MPLLPDLVTLAAAQAYLANSLPVDQSALPASIAAASSSVRRYCARDFTQWDYDEIFTGQDSRLLLRQFPVNSITRIASGLTSVLTITNNSTANSRALVKLTTTGDVTSGLVVTGITLTTVASGVMTTDTTTLFATYLTVGTVAAHINGLGNGWKATVTQSFANWASADMRAVQGNQNALSVATAGALFQIHTNDLSGWALDERTGIITLQGGSDSDMVWAYSGSSFVIGGSSFVSDPLGVRCQYNAGYATIPADIQQAVLITTQAMILELNTSHQYAEEQVREWRYKMADRKWFGIPDSACQILNRGGWRSYRWH